MSYSFYRTLTIDHTKAGASDSVNFPVAVFGTFDGTSTTPDLRTVANGGKVQSSSGFDIAFYSDSGLTTLLPFERVSWSGSTGISEFHVKVPTVSHSSDTVIYWAYGGTTGARTAVIYLNGAQDSSTTGGSGASNSDSADTAFLGTATFAQDTSATAITGTLTGQLDEVRISNSLRSADWITTEYNNQFSPSTFYTIGTETPISNGPLWYLIIQ